MPQVVGVDILRRAMRTLNDPQNVRWSMEELLDWLNDGQNEVAILRPDASAVVTSFALEALTTKQAIPATSQINATRLIDVIRNMGGDGATPGRPIRLVEREELDQYRPSWHTDTAATSIQNYVFDARAPRTFYVYPRPATAITVEAALSVVPTKVTVNGVSSGITDSVIGLDDVYATALYDYVCFRALKKNTDSKNDGEADRAYQAFLNRLGLKLQVDRSHDPNRNAPPKEPRRAQTNGEAAS